jgi:integrase
MPRGRIPRPWYRVGTQSWYTTIDGQQVLLGKQKRAAHAEFARLMATRGSNVGQKLTVREVVALWLADCERSKSVRTAENYRYYGGSFCEKAGNLLARDLKPFHVKEWVASHAWAQATEHLAVSCIRAAVRWAEEIGYIDSDPLHRLKRPAMTRRAPISLEDAEAVIGAVRPLIATALRILLVTGIRPGELCSLTGQQTSLDQRRAIVRGKTGERTIPLSDAACAVLGPLLRAHPAGPLLVGARGERLTTHALGIAVRRARKRIGLGDHVKPHCFRGLFATQSLRRGVDSALVSRLLGHRDASILLKHYAAPDDQMLRDAAERATRPGTTSDRAGGDGDAARGDHIPRTSPRTPPGPGDGTGSDSSSAPS